MLDRLLAHTGILELDAAAAREARERRERVYHAYQIPFLRRWGWPLFPLIMLAHNLVLGIERGVELALWFSLAYLVYGEVARFALRRWFGRTGRLHLGDLVLVLEVFVFAAGVYATGGQRSALFFLPFLHVADQTWAGFRRCLAFTQLGLVASLGLLGWLTLVEGRELHLGAEGIEILFCYLVATYWSVAAEATERMRRRSADAVRLARSLIAHLRAKQRELQESFQRAEEASRVKSRFLANISHEIRTPLGGVIGMTDLALESDLDDHLRECITTAQASARSLLTLLNDVLDLSKIEAGHLEIERIPVDLEDCLRPILRSLDGLASKKGVELCCAFESDVPSRVMGDPTRIGQVVTNLLSNAIKFTSEGHVELRVCVDRTRDRLVLEVEDTGIGIPPEKQVQVFAAFTQADGSTSRRFGGTGLGLAISSHLAELMGGEMSLESQPDEGSTFRLELPLEPAEEEQTVSRAVPALTGLRVGVASRRPRERAWLESWLSEAGAQVLDLAAEREGPDPTDLDLVVVDEADWAERDGCVACRTSVPLVWLIDRGGGEGRETVDERCGEHVRLVRPLLSSDVARGVQLAVTGVATGEHADRRKPTRSRRRTAAPLRVLLVEDNPVNLRLARYHLEAWGHRVDVAENGVIAVERWRTAGPQLILMDVQMPELDGLGATRAIRSEEGDGARVPIFALTANALAGEERRCLEAGMDAYLSKPIDWDVLFERIEALRRGAEREAG